MSTKNFVSYGDAETLFTEVENKLNTRLKQVTTMPPANAANLGKIVQYVGANSGSFFNNCFYKCILNDSQYIWSRVHTELGITNAMSSDSNFGSASTKSDLIDLMNLAEVHRESIMLGGDSDISTTFHQAMFYIDDTIDIMPSDTVIIAIWDEDLEWVYRAHSKNTAEDFAIIATGEAPNITAITITKLGGGTKYYLHKIQIYLKTPAMLYDGWDDTDAFTDNTHTDYWIGLSRNKPDGTYSRFAVSEFGLNNGNYEGDDVYGCEPFTLSFISPNNTPINNFYQFKTRLINSDLLHMTSGDVWHEGRSRITDVIIAGGDAIQIHSTGMFTSDPSFWDSGLTYFHENSPEMIFYIKFWFIADWTDTVTEWTA